MHAKLTCGARGPIIEMSLHLLPYFVYANNKGSSATAQAGLSIGCSMMQKVPKYHVLALIYCKTLIFGRYLYLAV